MVKVILFVRSKRTNIVTGHVSVETIGAVHTNIDYAEGLGLTKLSPEDSFAKDVLRRSGIKYDLVDLSDGLRTRISARIKGVKKTPTLLHNDSTPQRFVGIKAISEYATAISHHESRN